MSVPLPLEPGEYEANRLDLERTQLCSGCGAPMAWIRTEAGRAMPLSIAKARELPCPDCSAPGPDVPKRRLRCPRCRSTGKVYAVLNHWADCPNRDRFRRKKPKS